MWVAEPRPPWPAPKSQLRHPDGRSGKKSYFSPTGSRKSGSTVRFRRTDKIGLFSTCSPYSRNCVGDQPKPKKKKSNCHRVTQIRQPPEGTFAGSTTQSPQFCSSYEATSRYTRYLNVNKQHASGIRMSSANPPGPRTRRSPRPVARHPVPVRVSPLQVPAGRAGRDSPGLRTPKARPTFTTIPVSKPR